MASSPLVTILLLTYRHEHFIAEAVRSILAQTYRPLEIVILEDASPDGTWQAIARELDHHDRRDDVRVIRNPRNLGFRGNTIRGLEETHGEFVVRVAGDDIAARNLVERMVDVWQREQVSLVTVNASYIDAQSKSLNRIHCHPAADCDESFETLVRDGVNTACFGVAMGFERALYDEFGWAPEHLQASDIIMPFYAYLAKGVRFIREPLVRYRAHDHNLSFSLAAERAKDPIDKLIAEEHIFYLHLAHALFMDDELTRLKASNPERFGPIAERIEPLLAIQKTETARKLVRARIALREFGVVRMARPQPGV